MATGCWGRTEGASEKSEPVWILFTSGKNHLTGVHSPFSRLPDCPRPDSQERRLASLLACSQVCSDPRVWDTFRAFVLPFASAEVSPSRRLNFGMHRTKVPSRMLKDSPSCLMNLPSLRNLPKLSCNFMRVDAGKKDQNTKVQYYEPLMVDRTPCVAIDALLLKDVRGDEYATLWFASLEALSLKVLSTKWHVRFVWSEMLFASRTLGGTLPTSLQNTYMETSPMQPSWNGIG